MAEEDRAEPLERLLNLVGLLLETKQPLTFEQIRATLEPYGQENLDTAKRMFERDKDLLRDFGVPLELVDIDVWGGRAGLPDPQGQVLPAGDRLHARGAGRPPGRRAERGENSAAEQAARKLLYGADGGVAGGSVRRPARVGLGRPQRPRPGRGGRGRRQPAGPLRLSHLARPGLGSRRSTPSRWSSAAAIGIWWVTTASATTSAPSGSPASRGRPTRRRGGRDPARRLPGGRPRAGRHLGRRRRGSRAGGLRPRRRVVGRRAPWPAPSPERTRDDGWVEMAVPWRTRGSWPRCILQFGPEAEVVSPPSLRAEIVRRLEGQSVPERRRTATKTSERLGRMLVIVPYLVQHQGAAAGRRSPPCSTCRPMQLRRDLDLLFMSGLPPYGPGDLIDVEVDEDERIWIKMADHFARPLRLTRSEALALYLRGTELVATPGLPEAPALASALAKLRESLGPDALAEAHARIETVAASGRVPEHLELLRAAARVPRAPGDRVLRRLDGGVEPSPRSTPRRSSRAWATGTWPPGMPTWTRSGCSGRTASGPRPPRASIRAPGAATAPGAPSTRAGATTSPSACGCAPRPGGSRSTTPPTDPQELDDASLRSRYPPASWAGWRGCCCGWGRTPRSCPAAALVDGGPRPGRPHPRPLPGLSAAAALAGNHPGTGHHGVAPIDADLLKSAERAIDSTGEMTTIRTTCPRCGEVDMGPEAILLSVRQNGREGSYRFTCPSCSDDVEKRADRKIVALLVSAGVDIDQGEGAPAIPELFDDEDDDDPRGADARRARRSRSTTSSSSTISWRTTATSRSSSPPAAAPDRCAARVSVAGNLGRRLQPGNLSQETSARKPQPGNLV